MDIKFHPAVVAIKLGDIDRFRELIKEDATLATSRSSVSHPTLLQCVVLQGSETPNNLEMVRVLVDAGAELNAPLVACASCDNVPAAEFLLDHGAAINGSRATAGWTPVEEALYWNNPRMAGLLVRRGASIHNLRIAAGLGRTDLIENFFDHDGNLKPEAGTINWPWGDIEFINRSNFDAEGKRQLAAKVASWSNDRVSVLNNAFVYACLNGHIPAAQLLLQKGAQIDAIPEGFDYNGTGLHYAAYNGHRALVEFLIQHGADVRIKDGKVADTAAGWAQAGNHPEIKDYLERRLSM